jgi:hypothetical protein
MTIQEKKLRESGMNGILIGTQDNEEIIFYYGGGSEFFIESDYSRNEFEATTSKILKGFIREYATIKQVGDIPELLIEEVNNLKIEAKFEEFTSWLKNEDIDFETLEKAATKLQRLGFTADEIEEFLENRLPRYNFKTHVVEIEEPPYFRDLAAGLNVILHQSKHFKKVLWVDENGGDAWDYYKEGGVKKLSDKLVY